jgi:Amt family ammonium transporter
MKTRTFLVSVLALASLLLVVSPFAALADDKPPDLATVATSVADTVTAVNVLWMLIAGFLVFFMQAGFALVETGFTRTKNVAHTMMMNLMVFCIGALGYWLVGFAFQFGGANYTYPAIHGHDAFAFSPTSLGSWTGKLENELLIAGHGVLGLSGFMLHGLLSNYGVMAFFLFSLVFMDTAATIPTGSMTERFKFSGFVLMSFFISMFVYPMVAGWIWGGGWLANLGRSAGLGNGAVDFAGSGVVHSIGGAMALAGAMALGPRIGRFNKDGSANAIPGHNIPMGVLGTLILFFGWFGFNPGSALGFTTGLHNLATIAAINTLLAGAAGGASAMFYMWWFGPSKKPDPAMSVNGVLGGLVAITAPCAFVDTWAAVVIGLVVGVIVPLASAALEKLHVDDPVGAAPVHFFGGLWGVLSVGIFANGNPDSAGWNGITGPVTGLLYGGHAQILAQLAEMATIGIGVTALGYGFFKVLAAFGLLRSRVEDELAGLDGSEMGAPGYTTDDLVLHGGRSGGRIRGSVRPVVVPNLNVKERSPS